MLSSLKIPEELKAVQIMVENTSFSFFFIRFSTKILFEVYNGFHAISFDYPNLAFNLILKAFYILLFYRNFNNIQVFIIICFRFHKSKHSSVRHDRMRSQQIWNSIKAVKASKYGQLECLCRTFFYAFEEIERKD